MLRRMFPNVYEGWIVTWSAASALIVIAALFFYGFGAIFTEVIDEFHWSHGATALGFSLRNEAGGVAAPFMGALIDRFGARRVIVSGMFVSASGVLAMSFIETLWQFYAAILLTAIGTSAAGGAVGFAAIATWFERRRATAMSMMAVGGGLGGLLVLFVAMAVEEFGWRVALRIFAFLIVMPGVLIAMNVRSRPADHPQPMDGIPDVVDANGTPRRRSGWGIPWKRAIRSRSFILAQLSFAIVNFGTITVMILQIPYMEEELGVSKAAAGSGVLFFTITSIISRFGLGVLADKYPKQLILAGSAAIVVAGLPVMAYATNLTMGIVGVSIVGFGFGGMIPVRPALLADFFGTRNFGTISGIGQLLGTTSGALGPFIMGVTVDQTGSYQTGWLIAMVVTSLAVPGFLLLKPPHALIEEFRDAPAPVDATAVAT